MSAMTITQAEKAQRFAALHAAPGCFVIPNPWDPGSTRILENLGFRALATTSAGYAFSLGLLDGAVGLDAMIVALVRAGREMQTQGSFGWAAGATPGAEMKTLLR